ncbi:putative membrane protein with GtrA-like domain [Candidatus Regiella insecticola LSR1]|uniref:Putative membrane protein with GtrA-like domain n=1 Tax=Candidatus Regiella insecticola LSR1 TaxID=663321 RepID=E0WSU9_9ENTR|nr:GtrA family protein [Candidatus Regiella insecticola]EFL91634.1 putative membrane protein with GtrA-like domain [Candidatus Regiella insecticola LSR1]
MLMIKRELSLFLLVGTLTVLVDFLFYRSLIWLGAMGITTAKVIGFLLGTLFAYFANRFWTFVHRSPTTGSPWRFMFLYASTLCVNVLANALLLKWLTDIRLAFLLATGLSALLNFLGMKLFVFKDKTASELT